MRRRDGLERPAALRRVARLRALAMPLDRWGGPFGSAEAAHEYEW